MVGPVGWTRNKKAFFCYNQDSSGKDCLDSPFTNTPCSVNTRNSELQHFLENPTVMWCVKTRLLCNLPFFRSSKNISQKRILQHATRQHHRPAISAGLKVEGKSNHTFNFCHFWIVETNRSLCWRKNATLIEQCAKGLNPYVVKQAQSSCNFLAIFQKIATQFFPKDVAIKNRPLWILYDF